MLGGCDYNPGINGFGVRKILEHLTKESSFGRCITVTEPTKDRLIQGNALKFNSDTITLPMESNGEVYIVSFSIQAMIARINAIFKKTVVDTDFVRRLAFCCMKTCLSPGFPNYLMDRELGVREFDHKEMASLFGYNPGTLDPVECDTPKQKRKRKMEEEADTENRVKHSKHCKL